MSDKFKLFIGGSASTGSSLLAHMIGQHSKIFCGPETNLFAQSDWMVDWNKRKKNLKDESFHTQLSTGWHVHEGIQIEHLLSEKKIANCISQSADYKEFIHKIYCNVLKDQSNKVIAEKTPSNAPNFHLIDQIFENLNFILTIRNPLDAIASMRRRGWSLIYACGLYLFNISLGYSDSDRLKVIKYEDFVRDNESILHTILQSLNLDFETAMVENLDKMQVLPSWNPKGSTDDVFNNAERQRIEYLIDHLCFCEGYSFYAKKPYFQNIREIMNQFNYFKVKNDIGSTQKMRCTAELQIEKLKRKIRKYPLSGDRFPFEIR